MAHWSYIGNLSTAAALGILGFMAGCDPLILRADDISLLSTAQTESQFEQVRNVVRQVATKHGFQERPCQTRTNVLLCLAYEKNGENSGFEVFINSSDPHMLKMGYSSFGNFRDPSSEIFDEIRSAVGR